MGESARLPLPELISLLFKKMSEKEYSDIYTNQMRGITNKLQKYAQEINAEFVSLELLSAFSIDVYGKQSVYNHNIPCLSKMLLQLNDTGEINDNRLKVSAIPAEFAAVFEGYLDTRRERMRETTINSNRSRLAHIAKYLLGIGVSDVTGITREIIIQFTASLSCYSGKSASSFMSSLSDVLKHAYDQGFIANDVSRFCMKPRYYDGDKIPSVFTKDEIERMLAAVDRSTVKGKRDYAMLMIASRTGLRCSDVRNLQFCNLRFDTDSIEFTQSKTGKVHTLPMSEEVGTAIIDYLKNGRPASDSKYVFLGLFAPHNPVTGPLNAQVGRYMELAGVENFDRREPGYRSLRHSLASNMLRNHTSIYKIKEYLCHESIDATMRYIKIDHESLRRCALEVPHKSY